MRRLSLGVCVFSSQIWSFTLGHHAARGNFVLGETITHMATNRDPSNQLLQVVPGGIDTNYLTRPTSQFFVRMNHHFCFVTTIPCSFALCCEVHSHSPCLAVRSHRIPLLLKAFQDLTKGN